MSDNRERGHQDSSSTVLDPTMSLVGRLEDLSLGEILQIVSLSKRSGLLRLESPGGKASLYIRAGKVIFAATTEEKEGVLSLLAERGVITQDQLQPYRERLEASPSPEAFRDLLIEETGIGQEEFQSVLKARIEDLTFALFIWEQGTFSFQLIEDESSHPLLSKMTPFFLDEGIGAQFLVMEGARRKDEMMRDAPPAEDRQKSSMADPGKVLGDDWEQEFEQHLSGSAKEAEEPLAVEDLTDELDEFIVPDVLPGLPEELSKTVVGVGLQTSLIDSLAEGFSKAGIDLLVQEDGAEALTKIQELRQQGLNPYLLVDMEATGITDGRALGGLEVVSTMWDFGFHLPVGLICRREMEEELEAKLHDISSITSFMLSGQPDVDHVLLILNKVKETIETSSAGQLETHEAPVAGETQETDGQPDASPSVSSDEKLVDPDPQDVSGEGEEYYDIQQEFSEELGDIDLSFENGWGEAQALPQETSLDPHMARLSSYVNELNRQDISGEITLLALRFASVFSNRAILFLVRKDDLKGLGQFGVDLGQNLDADSVVRSLNLPLEKNSLFDRVAQQRQSYKGPPTDSVTENALFEALGGGKPREIFVGPIVSMGKVAVLLYGDDYPHCEGLEPTHTLDIFLSHVGLALDRAFLEMKLKSQRS